MFPYTESSFPTDLRDLMGLITPIISLYEWMRDARFPLAHTHTEVRKVSMRT